jgi:hypothetical protein
VSVPGAKAMLSAVDVEYRAPVPVRPAASTEPPAGPLTSAPAELPSWK